MPKDQELHDTRRQRLELFAKRHGVLDSPSALAKLIGKEPNQVTNLLKGHSSFGEKVARSIEAAAGLPAAWLDVSADQEEVVKALSHEALVIARALDAADMTTRQRVLNICANIPGLFSDSEIEKLRRNTPTPLVAKASSGSTVEQAARKPLPAAEQFGLETLGGKEGSIDQRSEHRGAAQAKNRRRA